MSVSSASFFLSPSLTAMLFMNSPFHGNTTSSPPCSLAKGMMYSAAGPIMTGPIHRVWWGHFKSHYEPSQSCNLLICREICRCRFAKKHNKKTREHCIVGIYKHCAVVFFFFFFRRLRSSDSHPSRREISDSTAFVLLNNNDPKRTAIEECLQPL